MVDDHGAQGPFQIGQGVQGRQLASTLPMVLISTGTSFRTTGATTTGTGGFGGGFLSPEQAGRRRIFKSKTLKTKFRENRIVCLGVFIAKTKRGNLSQRC